MKLSWSCLSIFRVLVGALVYAMGVKKHEVILMYLALSTLISLIAGCVGWAASIWFNAATLLITSDYYCIPHIPVMTSPLSIMYCILMPPVICFLINWMRLNKTFSMSPVSLLKGTFDTNITRHRKPKKGGATGLCLILYLHKRRRAGSPLLLSGGRNARFSDAFLF